MKLLRYIFSLPRFVVYVTAPLLYGSSMLACPACEKQQSAIPASIIHGAQPTGVWEYGIVGMMTALTLAVAVLSIRAILAYAREEESQEKHIKHIILE